MFQLESGPEVLATERRKRRKRAEDTWNKEEGVTAARWVMKQKKNKKKIDWLHETGLNRGLPEVKKRPENAVQDANENGSNHDEYEPSNKFTWLKQAWPKGWRRNECECVKCAFDCETASRNNAGSRRRKRKRARARTHGRQVAGSRNRARNSATIWNM